MKLTFKELYNSTQELIKKAKEPYVRGQNKRAFDSSIDSVEVEILNLQELIEKELSVVSEGKVINIQNIIDNKRKIKECQEIIDELKQFKDEFFELNSK